MITAPHIKLLCRIMKHTDKCLIASKLTLNFDETNFIKSVTNIK